jgi:uncharacterized protein
VRDSMARRFLAIAFGWSWLVAVVLFELGGIGSGLRLMVGGFAFMLGPAIAAVLVTRGMPKPDRRAALGFGRVRADRWLFLAWFVPAVLVAAATLGAALVPGTTLLAPAAALRAQIAASAGAAQAAKLDRFPPALLSALIVVQAFALGALVNAPFMLSEELGWRGALWSRWQSLGFAKHALATGVVWGLWHAPLVAMGHNYPNDPIAAPFLMTLFCVLLTPTLHLVRERGGTVWHACLFHGTINAGATLGKLCIVSPSWIGLGIVGVPGMLLLALASGAVLVVRTRRRPASPTGSESPSPPRAP